MNLSPRVKTVKLYVKESNIIGLKLLKAERRLCKIWYTTPRFEPAITDLAVVILLHGIKVLLTYCHVFSSGRGVACRYLHDLLQQISFILAGLRWHLNCTYI